MHITARASIKRYVLFEWDVDRAFTANMGKSIFDNSDISLFCCIYTYRPQWFSYSRILDKILRHAPVFNFPWMIVWRSRMNFTRIENRITKEILCRSQITGKRLKRVSWILGRVITIKLIYTKLLYLEWHFLEKVKSLE